MPSLGEMIPTMLAERGIAAVFGVPALATMELCRGLAQTRLRFVGAPGGAEAGFMADGHVRATGRPAACVVPAGPAVLALAPALAQARADAVPMLVITTTAVTDDDGAAGAHRGSLDGLDDLMARLCRFSTVVRDRDALAEAFDHALSAMQTGRPGPVHVAVPQDILAAIADKPPDPAPPAAPAAQPDPVALTMAVMRMSGARSPVLVFGEAARTVPRDDAVALAERLGARVLLSNAARGLLPRDHPALVRAAVSDKGVRAILGEAGAVLAIGCSFCPEEWGLAPGELLPVAAEDLVRVEADPDMAQRHARAEIVLIADPATAVTEILAGLEDRPPTPPAAIPSELRAQARQALPFALTRHEALLDSLWAHLPSALVFADPCEVTHAGLLIAEPPGPNQWHPSSGSFGAAGYAVWAAIGARVGDVERPIIALIGDATAPRQLAAVPVAVAARTPIIVLVWNNCGAGELRAQFAEARIEGIPLDVPAIDMNHVVHALGGAHSRVLQPGYLRDTLTAARERRKPTVIELREDYWFG